MENTKLDCALLAGLNAGIAEFRKNPYRFLYESDIQACLFSHLRQKVQGAVSVPRIAGGEPYILDLISSEYRKKLDLVCIDPVKVGSRHFTEADTYRGTDIYIYKLPLLLGVELKYAWMGYNKGFGHWCHDMVKLQGIREDLSYRLVLGFLQSNGLADGFYMQTGKKMKKTEDYQELPRLDGMFLVSSKVIKEVVDPLT